MNAIVAKSMVAVAVGVVLTGCHVLTGAGNRGSAGQVRASSFATPNWTFRSPRVSTFFMAAFRRQQSKFVVRTPR